MPICVCPQSAWGKNIFKKRRGRSASHQREEKMKKLLTMTAVSAIVAGMVAAEPSGTFRQAHELGFGAQSSLDPISKGRVFQITEKIMNRLVRPGLDGKPEPDLATS